MIEFPLAEQDASVVSVTFEPNPDSSTRKICEFVLDYNAVGAVIGIEIINLKFHAGPNSLRVIERAFQSTSKGLKYNYDDDSDCFYLTLAMEPSIDQKAVGGIVMLNEKGEIVALYADAREHP